MALTQSRLQLRNNIRRFADVSGANAVQRHPDTDLNEYIDRGLAAFHRLLTGAAPDQRILTSSTIGTVSGTTLYALPADFDHLISIDLTANGVKAWLTGYEMHERPALTDPATAYAGIPFTYRLRGTNIEFLPTPQGGYNATLWYVPNSAQFTADGDVVDTISRLDDYIIPYAARFVAVKDKAWDLVNECRTACGELEAEILAIARSRDKNSPARIVDVTQSDRWGRRRQMPGRWR